ncbi:pyridoxal phosphate-dependent aminotransferase [Pedobacter cryoconitis]|nr:pyridoxal phosphate-dependent aminotransferase [Pedobacter cryoconitis]
MSKTISDKVSSNPEIVNLSIGEPYFFPPDAVYNDLKSKLFTHGSYDLIPHKYAESKGGLSLRNEISIRYSRLYDASVDPKNEILITHGAAEAIWLSVLTLTSIGDEVIIPDPAYPMYETAVKLLGRVPVRLPTHADTNYCMDIQIIKKYTTANTKLIIINSPGNPTGGVYGRDLINEIAEFTKANGIYFVHDEVYDSYVFNDKHYNIFSLKNKIPDNCILINSFSKSFSMMSWRLGWMIGGEHIISNATKIHTNLTLNLGGFHQDSASILLNNEVVDSEVMVHFENIGRSMVNLWEAISKVEGIDAGNKPPKGGFFLFPNVSKLYEKIPNKFKTCNTIGECVTEYFLERYKIAVVPGCVYGQSGNDHIRIVVAVEEDKINQVILRLENN